MRHRSVLCIVGGAIQMTFYIYIYIYTGGMFVDCSKIAYSQEKVALVAEWIEHLTRV